MRRLMAAAALVTVVLMGAGCADNGSVTASPSSSPSVTVSPTPSVDPSAKTICDDITKNILDTDAKALGVQLGKLVAARAQGDKAAQQAAQQQAAAKLHEIAGKVRTHASEASDPQLKDALSKASENLDRLANDTAFFDQITSLDMVGDATKKFTQAVNDVVQYCNR
jgi:hypothetical protein